MAGPLVIPTLIYIKVFRLKDRQASGKAIYRENISEEFGASRCVSPVKERASAQGFKGLNTLQMGRDAFELMALLFVPDNFVVMV